MGCDNIEVKEDKQTIEITDKGTVIELNSDESNVIEVTNESLIIELKEERKVIEVSNVAVISPRFYQVFIPTVGQSVFILNRSLDAAQILLSQVFVNPTKLLLTNCYTIVGNTLTITTPYSLDDGDILEIYY